MVQSLRVPDGDPVRSAILLEAPPSHHLVKPSSRSKSSQAMFPLPSADADLHRSGQSPRKNVFHSDENCSSQGLETRVMYDRERRTSLKNQQVSCCFLVQTNGIALAHLCVHHVYGSVQTNEIRSLQRRWIHFDRDHDRCSHCGPSNNPGRPKLSPMECALPTQTGGLRNLESP